MAPHRVPRPHAFAWISCCAALAGCSGKKEEQGAAPSNGLSALVLTLDTTRPDALTCYGAGMRTTPNLDVLAAEGIVFEDAFTSIPITLPSHASLWTGLYPPRHGLRENGQGALASAAKTFAEVAAEHRFQTAAFVGAVVLDPSFGLAQGFEVYDAPKRDPQSPEAGPERERREAERPARAVVDAALAWLAKRDKSRPFLLWCHFYDPHTPYQAPEDLPLSSADLMSERLPPEYLREVRGMDREIGRLLDALRADGTLAKTVVVAAGDHGESFGEHGEKGHGILCHGATLHVPLVLRLPEGWSGPRRSGERSQAIASLVDVFPTLSDALGFGAPGDVDGLDLLGTVPEDRGVYFESYSGFLSYGWSPVTGWLDAKGKLVHGSAPAFYDWRADPEETTSAMPADVERYRRGIAGVAAKPSLAAEGDVAEDLVGDLRGLGYAAVGGAVSKLPGVLDSTGLPAPETMWELHDESVRGLEFAMQGSLAEAEPIFLHVLEANPKNAFVLEQLATCQVQSGRLPEAAETLKRILHETPGESARIWFRLGSVLRAQGKLDDAIQALRRADDLAPNRPTYLRELYSALMDAGKKEEAKAVSKRLSAQGKG